MPDPIEKYSRIFLDTNVYIVGAADPSCPEGKILEFLGFEEKNENAPEVVISKELVEQILRVGKRLKGKDWAGKLMARVWQNFNLVYVLLDAQEISEVEALQIPREDIGVYLTAKQGKAECFVSSNHKLRAISFSRKAEDARVSG
jgi:predicted nucleic acid-binding protein